MFRPLFSVSFGCTAFCAVLLSPLVSAHAGVDFYNDRWAEAQLLAVELSGELEAPNLLTAQIAADLASIRADNPDWASVTVFPAWLPGEVLVSLTPEAFAQHQSGGYPGFVPLYGQLGYPSIQTHVSSQSVWMDFNRVYHGNRLDELFESLDDVVYADPNFLYGDGDDITAYEGRKYVFKRGYGDCPSGCIFEETEFFDLGGTAPLSISGDYNADGTIDAADYTVWRDHVGDPSGTLPNDPYSSAIGPAQYSIWAVNYETLRGSGASVPEPFTAALLLTGGACQTLARPPRPRRP